MDEQKGIEAIIYLQSLSDITESEDDARKGWQGMSPAEQNATMAVYAAVVGLEDIGITELAKEPENQ
jgi:hypothetical protein